MSTSSAGSKSLLENWLEESRSWADSELEVALNSLRGAPSPLFEAMHHACLAGGKRLRPALTRLFCESAGGDVSAAVLPSVAIEMVHTYSLVHDDLPCMDDDDMRRGEPTVHKKWDEATAVLAGDALLTEAFSVLAAHPQAGPLVGILAAASGALGMVGGQVSDLGVDLAALRESERLPAVLTVHATKTAALFGAACEMGCVAGGGTGSEHAREYGYQLGMLFQATDDVIDVTGTAAGIGKTPGKDADLDRPTLVAALGLDGARERAELHAKAALTAAAGFGLSKEHLACSLVGFLTSRTH